MRNNFYVYAHLCPDTDEVRYIGKGTGGRSNIIKSYKRFGYHKNWLIGLETQNKKPKVKILCSNLSEDKAYLLEIELIKHYKRFNKLTNLTNGGDGIPGYKHNQETKLKQSKSAYKRNSKGIGYDSRCKEKPWWARIKINGKRTYLGYFKTKEEAEFIYSRYLKTIITED